MKNKTKLLALALAAVAFTIALPLRAAPAEPKPTVADVSLLTKERDDARAEAAALRDQIGQQNEQFKIVYAQRNQALIALHDMDVNRQTAEARALALAQQLKAAQDALTAEKAKLGEKTIAPGIVPSK